MTLLTELRTAMLVIFLCAGPFVASSATTDQQGTENGFDLDRLKRGEILVQSIHTDQPGGAARVTALFHTDATAVWNIIGYCKYEFAYVRGLQECEVLKPGLSDMLVHHRVRNSWYMPSLSFTFQASRKDNTGVAHLAEGGLTEGDLAVFEGKWRMVPLGDGTGVIVVHEIRLQPKLPAPRWLVRRSLRKDLPDMLACIRGLANASGDNSRIATDLKRCPGKISP